MDIFTAIALTALFAKSKMAIGWIVWCWTNAIYRLIKEILSKKEE